MLDGIKEVKQSRYLGLSMVIERIKKQVFTYIKERVVKKLSSWKEKLLSNTGKEVLLKSVEL